MKTATRKRARCGSITCTVLSQVVARELYVQAKVDYLETFLDPQVFPDVCKHCKDYGINVPIVPVAPSIMCLNVLGDVGENN